MADADPNDEVGMPRSRLQSGGRYVEFGRVYGATFRIAAALLMILGHFIAQKVVVTRAIAHPVFGNRHELFLEIITYGVLFLILSVAVWSVERMSRNSPRGGQLALGLSVVICLLVGIILSEMLTTMYTVEVSNLLFLPSALLLFFPYLDRVAEFARSRMQLDWYWISIGVLILLGSLTYAAYDSRVHLHVAEVAISLQKIYTDGTYTRNAVYPPLYYFLVGLVHLPIAPFVPPLSEEWPTSIIAITIVQTGSLALAVKYAGRMIEKGRRCRFYVYCLASPFPLIILLFLTHADAVVAACLLLTIAALDSSDYRLAGFGAASAAAVKMWPVFPAIVLLVRNRSRWREIVSGSLPPVLLTLSLVALHPINTITAFFGSHRFGLHGPASWPYGNDVAGTVGIENLASLPWLLILFSIVTVIAIFAPLEDERIAIFLGSTIIMYQFSIGRHQFAVLILAAYLGYRGSSRLSLGFRIFAWVGTILAGLLSVRGIIDRAPEYPAVMSKVLPYWLTRFDVRADWMFNHPYSIWADAITMGTLLLVFLVGVTQHYTTGFSSSAEKDYPPRRR